ncbi:IDEAL domain-containing protein [Virgibacillus sp. AGTR]|uniref:IDEAL domain-containing protein n=1 Tax=Virgibacillus TaxID=84406 RepID=UPI001D16E4EC|nr:MULTISPECIES: IDEAL domain-containing protein [unclassified Virgibacillus]MCC2249094.1 IDEAL domain-containing protein [Virgibacillus sp. AGTR]MDY7044052.1 IDEAL domain-containing protein [Virgibacillus sp. M23]
MYYFENDDYMKRILNKIYEVEMAKYLSSVSYSSKPAYEKMEYDCKTSVTDEDILNILIDYALDTGNRELFFELTKQLNNQPSLYGGVKEES